MAFLTRYELWLGLEPVSKVKTKKVRKCGESKENLKGGGGGGFLPAEMGLNCCKKLYTVRKKLVDFSLLINFTSKKIIFIVLGD